LKTYEIVEQVNGVITGIKLSSGEEFPNWDLFKQYAVATKATVYGEGLHQLVTGLKGAGEKPRISSWFRNGNIAKIKYKNLTMVDLKMWDLELKADEESCTKIQRLMDELGDISISPAGEVNKQYFYKMTSWWASILRQTRPSLTDAFLSSGKLPGRWFRPAYVGGMLASPADAAKVYEEVSSFDIRSCYPYSALASLVPVSTSRDLSEEEIAELEIVNGEMNVGEGNGFIALFTVNGFKRKPWVRIPTLREGIDEDKDEEFITDLVKDRIGILSGSIEIAMNPYELRTFCLQYDFDSIVINNVSVHELGKIPKAAEEFILESFHTKNSLPKGHPQRETAKTALNTIIGFWGTDPFCHMRSTKIEEGEVWTEYTGNLQEGFDKYAGTEDKTAHVAGRPRTWDFRWAGYILANARLRIALADRACYEAGLEVLYSDTDSIKVNGDPAVADEVFEKLNSEVKEGLDIDGLGLWVNETEGFTRGAFRGKKKYILETKEGIRESRLAGVKSEEAVELLADMTLEEFATPEIPVWLTVIRRMAGVMDMTPFGFTDVYALYPIEMKY
jgi:hypothetical protein